MKINHVYFMASFPLRKSLYDFFQFFGWLVRKLSDETFEDADKEGGKMFYKGTNTAIKVNGRKNKCSLLRSF